MADIQSSNLDAACKVYDSEVVPCPRSAEWKVGARAGIFKAFDLPFERSPYSNGSAQDDARRSGFLMGHAMGCDARTAQAPQAPQAMQEAAA